MDYHSKQRNRPSKHDRLRSHECDTQRRFRNGRQNAKSASFGPNYSTMPNPQNNPQFFYPPFPYNQYQATPLPPFDPSQNHYNPQLCRSSSPSRGCYRGNYCSFQPNYGDFRPNFDCTGPNSFVKNPTQTMEQPFYGPPAFQNCMNPFVNEGNDPYYEGGAPYCDRNEDRKESCRGMRKRPAEDGQNGKGKGRFAEDRDNLRRRPSLEEDNRMGDRDEHGYFYGAEQMFRSGEPERGSRKKRRSGICPRHGKSRRKVKSEGEDQAEERNYHRRRKRKE